MSAKLFKIKVKKNGYPVILPVDGFAIDATVTRFTLQQRADFITGFERVQDPHSRRLVSVRLPGEEQAKHTVPGVDGAPPREQFVIDDAEIRRRRLVEMTADQRAEYERQDKADEEFAAAFIGDALAAYLTIAPGQITEDDDGIERDITSGADFARIFGGRMDVLFPALRAIHNENTLSESLKNVLSSLRAFPRSSDAREQTDMETTAAAPGRTLEDPAPNVESAPCATSEIATGLSAETSSGTTAAATT